MEIIKYLYLLALLTGASAFASDGTKDGGGDGAVVLPNDQVVLADAFYQDPESEALIFSKELKTELDLASHLLVRYGMFPLRTHRLKDSRNGWHMEDDPVELEIPSSEEALFLDYSQFIYDYVFEDNIEFRYVESLPCQDRFDIALPVAAKFEFIACTEGPVTYLNKELFTKLTLIDQAALIVHERMHALPMQVPHEYIIDITRGLRLAMQFFDEQKNGGLPKLSEQEVKFIRLMIDRIVRLKLNVPNIKVYNLDERFLKSMKNDSLLYRESYDREDIYVSPNGGGIVYAPKFRHADNFSDKDLADLYVSAGSFVSCLGCHNSNENGQRISKTNGPVNIINSIVDLDDSFIFGRDVMIKDSVVESSSLEMQENALIQSSNIFIDQMYNEMPGLVMQEGARIVSSAMNAQRLTLDMGKNSEIANLPLYVSATVKTNLATGCTFDLLPEDFKQKLFNEDLISYQSKGKDNKSPWAKLLHFSLGENSKFGVKELPPGFALHFCAFGKTATDKSQKSKDFERITNIGIAANVDARFDNEWTEKFEVLPLIDSYEIKNATDLNLLTKYFLRVGEDDPIDVDAKDEEE